uniref:Calponin n=1 Tax=Sus scrofa TaxID=9823 RepID=A0A8D1V2D0_PIG
MSSAHFNRGPAYGLSAEVKNKLAQKYDHQQEQELREWIEGVTGRRIGNNFMDGLKDGIILCEFINKLQPGSVKKVNESTQNWHQLENIGNFIKAITKYGVKPHDIFEANDLFENTNHTQVQSTLLALASMAKTKGNKVNVGVKYAEKQERKFEPEKLREGRNIIGLQMGTNKFASQQGMTAYGTRRHLYDPKLGTDQPLDQATISLQMGTNKGASQAGMTAPGTKRQIFEPGLANLPTTTTRTTTTTLPRVLGLPPSPREAGCCSWWAWPGLLTPSPCMAPPAPWHLPTGLVFVGSRLGSLWGGRGHLPGALRGPTWSWVFPTAPKGRTEQSYPAVPHSPQVGPPPDQKPPQAKPPEPRLAPPPTPFPQWEQTACPETQRTHAVWFAAGLWDVTAAFVTRALSFSTSLEHNK